MHEAGPPVGTGTTLFFREGLRDRVLDTLRPARRASKRTAVRYRDRGWHLFCREGRRDRATTLRDPSAARQGAREPDDRGLDDDAPHPGAAAGNGAAQPCSEPPVGLRRAAFMRRPLARVSCILRFLPIPHIPYSCQAKSAGNKANFPPPLRGRVRVGGLQHSVAATRLNRDDPSPYPLPQGEGESFVETREDQTRVEVLD